MNGVRSQFKSLEIVGLLTRFCAMLIIFVSMTGWAQFASADSVGQAQVTKFFAPKTIQMLLNRVNSGNPGIQPGDSISYIIESVPVDDGGTQGVNGYITDYVPLGLQVTGVSFVDRVPSPNLPGGFDYVARPLRPAGLMQSGVGGRGGFFLGPVFFNGALPQGTQDTGIFFSTDPRTARIKPPLLPYTLGVNGCTGAGFLPGIYNVFNKWDYAQFLAFGNGCSGGGPASLSGGQGAQPIVTLGVGLGYAGLGSPVAGSLTYYSNDYNPGLALLPATPLNAIVPALAAPYLGIGPWQRINYAGSTMGGSGAILPTLVAGGGGGGATAGVSTAVPTSAGRPVSAGFGLPYNPAAITPGTIGHTNAVRWAFGQRMVGAIERVKITFTIQNIANFGSPSVNFQNHSSVFGGDITAPGAGQDLTYKYLAPTQSISDARIMLTKSVVATALAATGPWTPASGATLVPRQFVKYRITYLNGTATSLSGFSLHDIIDVVSMLYSPLSATTGVPFLAAPLVTATGVDWNPLPLSAGSVLAPGEGGYVELIASVIGGPNTLTTNIAYAKATAPIVDAYAYAPSSIFLIAPANLTQNKTVSPSAVAAGGLVKYSVTVTSLGGPIDTTQGVIGGGIAPNIYPAALGLLIGDHLDVNFAYTSTISVALRDRTTGVIYPYAAGDPYTVPLGPAALPNTGVFWAITGYPLSYPAPVPLPAAANFLTGVDILIDFYATANLTAAPGTYYNKLTSYAGEPVNGIDIAWSSTGLAPVSVTNATGFPTLIFNKSATDLNAGALNPGDKLRYGLTLTNSLASPLAATNPILIDPLPAGLSYVVGSQTSTPLAATISYSNNYGTTYLYVPPGLAGTLDPYVTHIKYDFTAPFPTGIAPGGTVSAGFDVQLPTYLSHATTISNQATIDAYSALISFQQLSDDPITLAPSDATVSTVSAPADFTTSTKTVVGNTGGVNKVAVGDVLTYTITVANSAYNASNVLVSDTIDLNSLTFNAIGTPLPTNWSVSGPDAAGKISWRVANMATGTSATLSFTATVKSLAAGSAIDNAVMISSNESLPLTVNAPTLSIPITLITGTVFNDANNNGTLNIGEAGVAGVSVALRVPSFTSDIVTAVTDANGFYSITVPIAADWYVQVTDTALILAGYTPTTTQPLPVTIASGSTVANQHFGYFLSTLPATVNGIISAAAAGFHAGVTLVLKNSLGSVVANAATNAIGAYSFTGLAPGNYALEVTDTAGILNNEYLVVGTPSPISITGLLAGTTLSYNFTYNTGSRIGDLIFADANNNRLFDVLSDTGIAGVTVNLLTTGGLLVDTYTTDVNGAYLFQGVAPGNYNVVITDTALVLTGFTVTTVAASPFAVTASSGVDTLTGDFGYNALPGFTVSKTVDKGVAGFNESVQYTITIDNYGGAAANFLVRDILPSASVPLAVPAYTVSPNSFLYLSTVSTTLNGIPFTPPTQPISLSTQPSWSGFTLPAATTLEIVFTAFTGANEGVNYNGVHTEYNNNVLAVPPASVADFPNLALVTISSVGTVSKKVQAINGVPWFSVGTPVVVAGDVVTYRVTLDNSPAAIAQSVTSIYENMPAGFVYQGLATSSMLVSPYNQPLTMPVPVQLGQKLTWTFAAPTPATAAAYPSRLYLDFNLIAPAGVTATYTDNATMNAVVGVALPVPASSGDVAPVTVTQFKVGDLIYKDINANGVFNAATDLYASGVTVLLSNGATTTTDIYGAYNFQLSVAGTYTITVTDTGGVLLGYTATTGGNSQTTTVNTATPTDLLRDFGYQPPAATSSLTGTLFADNNGNTVKDLGEAGIAGGVFVELRNLFGVVIDSYTTDANGAYHFLNMAGGLYQVAVPATPAGFAGPTTVLPLAITVADGANMTGVDVGFGPFGSVSGTVFNDLNGNGILDGAEVGLNAGTIDLYTLTGVLQATVSTGAGGAYIFSGVANGNYKIYVRQDPAGYGKVSVQPLAVTAVVATVNTGNDVAYQQYITITGMVFADVDNSASFNAGDALLSGATVYLKLGASIVDTYTTTALGIYEFKALLGTATSIAYTVDVNQALAPINAAVLTTGNEPQAVTIATAGATHHLTDIGYRIQGSISGTVYEDKNGTLVYDLTPLPADTALVGATVTLYDAGGMTVLSTTTSAVNGSFSFTGLIGGSYTVEVTTPIAYSAVAPAILAPAIQPRRAINLLSGTAANNQDFAFTLPANLSVSKTTPSAFTSRDSPITYTITVSNTGGTANYVQVTDWVPNLVAPVGWLGIPAPTPSVEGVVIPSAITPTQLWFNGVQVIGAFPLAALPLAPYTQLTVAGATMKWSTVTGGFTLNTGDSLKLVFTVDSLMKGTQGSFFNSLQVDYYSGAIAQPTLWYPDINVVGVTKTYTMDKKVIAVNGVPWGGGTPTIDVGNIVTYQVTVVNQRGKGKITKDQIAVVSLIDSLPLGFKYVLGSSKTVSPGNSQPLLTPILGLLNPVVTPATLTTKEVLSYTFNGGVIPAKGGLPIVGDSMITGPNMGDTATLQFDVYAEDILTPNIPLAGLHDNRNTTSANRLGKGAGILQTFIGATVNVSTRAHVKGTVFHELTVDGVYNAATLDTTFNGVTVELQPSGGGIAIDTYTTVNGFFDLVAPGAGSYQVVVTDVAALLTGFVVPPAVSPAVMPFTITDGYTLAGQDYGYVLLGTPATINGTIFTDVNANGLLDAGDTGILAATVKLTTLADTVLATTTTTAAGLFTFSNLAAGTYKINVVNSGGVLYPLNGLYNTPAAAPVDPYTLTITAATTTSKNFGWAVGATFSGTVFDAYSALDAIFTTQPSHPNVTMNLVNTITGATIRTTTTASSPVSPALTPLLGSYAFDAVAPGSYRIDVTDAFGELTTYALTTANQPMIPVAASGGIIYTNNFGYFKAPNITVFKTMTSSTLDRGAKMDVTLTVSNTGGGVAAFSVADVMPAAAAPVSPFVGGLGGYLASIVDFVYEQTLSVTLNGVPLTVGTGYTAPLVLSLTPTWILPGGLPGNSTLVIHFTGIQPAATVGSRGAPNYNGVAIQYGPVAAPVTVDYPNLITFSVVRDLTFNKRISAINAIPYTGFARPVIHPGDTVTFQLAVGNMIRGRQIDVTSFSDTLPADSYGNGLTYVLGSSILTNPLSLLPPALFVGVVGVVPGISPYTFIAGGSQTLTWTLAQLASTNASFPSEVVMQFDAYASPSSLPGLYLNQGGALAARTRRTPTLVNASRDFDLTYNLLITKVANVSTVALGGTLVYTVTITNLNSTGSVGGLTLLDQLDNGFSYAAGSTSFNGVVQTVPPAGTSTQPIWTLPPIVAGSPLTVTFTANVANWTPLGSHPDTASLKDLRGVIVATTGATAAVSIAPPQPLLTILKTVTTFSDPFNLTTNPLAIPGAQMMYSIQVNNSGGGAVDTNTIVVVDPLDANLALMVVDINGAGSGPLVFLDNPGGVGAVSGLTYTFTALASSTDDIAFSNDNGTTYAYTPVADANGVDTAVTHIKISPKGAMAAAVAGSNPNFELRFKAMVK